MPIKRPPTPDREFRIVTSDLRVERRADSDAPGKIVGHAAVFDQWTVLHDGTYFTWKEVVRPGAFRNALAEQQDVLACINHDRGLILGRSTSGTLSLSEDATGLLVTIDPPDTQTARDLVVLIGRRDLTGMSFAFRVRPGGDRTVITSQGDKQLEERELLDLNLLDVSVVTDPAYPQTDVAVRSLAELRDRPHRDPWLNRAWARLRLAEATS
jgi:HK97 family phage prohead protease